jgi:hypothetical protein
LPSNISRRPKEILLSSLPFLVCVDLTVLHYFSALYFSLLFWFIRWNGSPLSNCVLCFKICHHRWAHLSLIALDVFFSKSPCQL